MNSLLYAKLAKTNLSKNRQNILPYWLSCIGTVIMFYIMSTLSLSEGLKKMMGKATIQIVMQFGVYIIGLFAVIFLIYSNSFLAKRRKKEFGLFQILGMEKKHLAKSVSVDPVGWRWDSAWNPVLQAAVSGAVKTDPVPGNDPFCF